MGHQQTEIAPGRDPVVYFLSRHHGYLPQGSCPMADSMSWSKAKTAMAVYFVPRPKLRLEMVMVMEGQRLPRRVVEAPLPPTFV
jgi:hypothetical protein